MTVKELKEKLNEFPDEMEVFIPSNETDYDCVHIEDVKKSTIIFYNNDDTEKEMIVVKIEEY